jgi:FHA domain
MSLFSEFEKSIERGFRRWTERMFGASHSDDLVSLHHAILEEIESKVETVARGRRVFPYAHLVVTLASPDAERRAVLAAAFAPRLREDVAESLRAAGCDPPPAFAVEIRTAESGERPFAIEYSVGQTIDFRGLPTSGSGLQAENPPASGNAGAGPSPAAPENVGAGHARPAPAALPARLIVTKGQTEHAEYVLEKPRTNLGRLPELMDADQRIARRNDIVFEEGADGATSTVSRQHAHIRRDGPDYRLCDDGSEFGTRVFRDGRSIDVPAGNRRGEKLRPGDEIYLGRACLRFEL